MADKKLRLEKKMDRSRVIKRVPSHGYGINNKYKSKPGVVCYSVLNRGSFVSYTPNKFQKMYRTLKWKLYFYIRVLFLEDKLNFERRFKYSTKMRNTVLKEAI